MKTYTIWIEFLDGEQRLLIRAAEAYRDGGQYLFVDEAGALIAEVPEAIVHDVKFVQS